MIYWIQITSGRGPEECCWVVTRLSEHIVNEAELQGLRCRTIDVIPGDKPRTARSVLISLEGNNIKEFVATYEGSVQWIGKSMFRPHHKRKNWFVGDNFRLRHQNN